MIVSFLVDMFCHSFIFFLNCLRPPKLIPKIACYASEDPFQEEAEVINYKFADGRVIAVGDEYIFCIGMFKV